MSRFGIIKNNFPTIYKYGALIYRKRLCMTGIRINFIQKFVENKLYQRICDGNPNKLPIYILSYNRLSYLKTLISYLEEKDLRNIIIVDNASTYPPLLEYYGTIPYPIMRMDKNYGHKVFFEHKLFRNVRWFSHYVFTDPDVIPIDECPDNIMDILYNTLKTNQTVYKVGLSLKIDDIPDTYEYKSEVIDWESRFYNLQIKTSDNVIYDAPIDTTFALYRPQLFCPLDFLSALRTGYPYQARHMPWYKARDNLTDEDEYYISSTVSTTGNWNYDVDKDVLHERYG